MGAASEYLKIRADWDGRQVERGIDQIDSRMGRLRSSVAAMPPLVRQAGAALLAGFGVNLGKAIVDRTAEIAQLGAQSKITEKAFDSLAERAGTAGETELARLRAATDGTLSDLKLMATVGAGVESNLTFDQSAATLEYLYRYSLAYQKNFDQLTSTIFTGLSRGSTLMLDDAGIIIDASSDIYKGLSEVEKKAKLVADAIEIMRQKTATLREASSNAVTETARLRVEGENLLAAVGREIENPFAKLPSFLSMALRDIRKRIESASFLDRSAQYYSVAKVVTPDPTPTPLATINYRTPQTPRIEDALRARHGSSPTLSFSPNTPSVTYATGQEFDIATFFKQYVTPNMFDNNPTRQNVGAAFSPITTIEPRRDDRVDDLTDDLLSDVDAWATEVQRYQHETAVIAARASEDMIAQEKLAYNLRIATAEQSGRALGLSEDDIAARRQAITDEHKKNLEDIKKRSEESEAGLSGVSSDLSLLSVTLGRLSPELGSFVGGINQIIQSIETYNNAQSLLGEVAGAVGVVSAGVSALGVVAGFFQSRAARARQIEEQNRRTRERYRQEQEKLNEVIEDAADLAGRFARSLSGLNTAQIRSQIGADIDAIQQALGRQGLTPENIIQESDRIRALIRTEFTFAGQFDERFSYLYRHLNEAVTAAQLLEERKADAEIAAREEQAQIIIEAIERQRQAVLQKLADAEEAQRAAALRAVGAQFDFLEAEMRARYQPQLKAVAGDDAATLVLREQVFADIERLRQREGAAGQAALQGVSQSFADARDRTNALYDGMVKAVRDAIPDLSQPFVSAIAEQTQAFLSRWDQGLVLFCLGGTRAWS